MLKRPVFVLLIGVALAVGAGPSLAQSTNALPVVSQSQTAANPDTLPLPADAKRSVRDALSKLKSGSIVAHVTAVSANQKSWAANGATADNFVTLGDLARQTLETCEYLGDGPCMLVEINGNEARDANGDWLTEPRMLEARSGGKFDQWTVPFVSLADRNTLSDYAQATGPRALVLTAFGSWTWVGGKTILDAVDSAFSSCQKDNSGTTCILYAVDDDVVMAE
jgi:hypothetical protein